MAASAEIRRRVFSDGLIRPPRLTRHKQTAIVFYKNYRNVKNDKEN
ncbi:hypothetical protein HMPREF9123_2060 [Neisseria bacilliformis ATCC BAA-1200]|uniref:Uncharacterized protein n=1 Tax=Neisseria bacilliformis ATCC BAA-1200 TaxID=888742 RepID=F2BEA4_9NEIS|nr:hypothetical protein HMPREF9123_2060 [Neisseria bacilliformis ATCC BAA-1200]